MHGFRVAVDLIVNTNRSAPRTTRRITSDIRDKSIRDYNTATLSILHAPRYPVEQALFCHLVPVVVVFFSDFPVVAYPLGTGHHTGHHVDMCQHLAQVAH